MIHNRTDVNRNCSINFEIVVRQQWQQVVFGLVLCRFGAVEFFLSHFVKKKSEIILFLTENHWRQFGRCWWFRLRSHQIQCSFENTAFPTRVRWDSMWYGCDSRWSIWRRFSLQTGPAPEVVPSSTSFFFPAVNHSSQRSDTDTAQWATGLNC